MTALLRRDFTLLAVLVLLQAGTLVWLGGAFDFRLAAVTVIGLLLAATVLPAAGSHALAGLRVLFHRLTWWQWLWALLFLSDLTFRERDVQSVMDSPLDAWALYRVSLVGVAGIVLLWRVVTRRGYWVRPLFSGMVLIMAAFPLMGLFSTAWSVYPAWTLYKSVELLIDLSVLAAAVASAGTAGDLKDLFDWNWLLLACLQASVWLGALIWPQQALLRGVGALGVQLIGVFPSISSNGVGHIAAMLCVVALARLLDHRAPRGRVLLYSLVFLSSAATLVFSQTRSALGAFAAGAALVLLLSRRTGLIATVTLAGVILLTASTFESAFLTYFRRGQDAELLESFSGRVGWWRFAWARLMEQPWIGYGAFAGGRFASLAAMGDQLTSSLHNTYLEALLGIGVVGLTPVVACLTGVWWQLVKALCSWTSTAFERSIHLEAVGVLMVITVRSFFTTDLIWHPALSWFLVLGYAELLRRQRRTEVV